MNLESQILSINKNPKPVSANGKKLSSVQLSDHALQGE